jgi:putative ABC transport system permease protein
MMPFRLSTLVRKSLADSWRRKGRTLLIVLGILIGVMGLTAIDGSADALLTAFTFQEEAPSPPDVVMTIGKLDPQLLAAITALPNVRAVQQSTNYDTLWHVSAAPGHVVMRIISYPDLQHVSLTPFQLTSGRYPGPGEIALDDSDRVMQDFAVGDVVTVDTGQGTVRLRIVGIARTAGIHRLIPFDEAGAAVGYMSDGALQQAFAVTNAPAPAQPSTRLYHLLHGIGLRLQSPSQAQTTAQTLVNLVGQYEVGSALAIGAYSPTSINLDLINGFFTLLRILAGMALALMALLIINTVSTTIAEQTQIVGIMKALGGTRAAIFSSYLLSVFFYSLVGAALGVLLGLYGGARLATWLATAADLDLGPQVVAPWVVAVSLGVGIGVALLAACWPLVRGTRISVRDALASHGVRQGRDGGALGGRGRLLSGVSLIATLGVRSTFRKPGRAFVTVLTLTLAGTTFLAVQTANYAIRQHVNNLYAAYAFDAQLDQGPAFDQIRPQVLAVPNIALVEPWEQQPFRTRWGQLDLAGVAPDTRIYHHRLISGRWFSGDEPNALVLSAQAAQHMGLRVGATLTFSDLPSLGPWTVLGIVDDPSGSFGDLGAAATTLNNFNRLAGNTAGSIHSELIQARDRSQAAVDELALQLDAALNTPSMHQANVATARQLIQQQQRGYAVLDVTFSLLTLLVGLAGALGLFTTLMTAVVERQREIGVLRVLGAGTWRVARTFWTEGATLSLLAWAIGVMIGVPLAYVFVALVGRLLLQVPFAFDPVAFVEMLLVLLVIATVASVGPAARASHLRLAALLQYE